MTQAIYIRTSTTDQDGQAQLAECRKAAEARRWDFPWEHIDIGHSGTKASRPELDKLKAAIARGGVKEVMVYALDRLGRNLRELLLLLDEWAGRGVNVIVLREGLDLSTPVGRLQMQMLGAFAEFERNIIAERVRSGLVAARAAQEAGKVRYHKDGRKKKDIGRPRREIDAAEVATRRARGDSWRDIARAMKIPTRTLHRISNPVAKTL